MKAAEDRFSIHVRAWGAGVAVWMIGFTTILGIWESPWLWLLMLLLIPVGWAVWDNEKLPRGVKK